jgi:hypothetical protein
MHINKDTGSFDGIQNILCFTLVSPTRQYDYMPIEQYREWINRKAHRSTYKIKQTRSLILHFLMKRPMLIERDSRRESAVPHLFFVIWIEIKSISYVLESLCKSDYRQLFIIFRTNQKNFKKHLWPAPLRVSVMQIKSFKFVFREVKFIYISHQTTTLDLSTKTQPLHGLQKNIQWYVPSCFSFLR